MSRFVVMGVSGAGKSLIGRHLSEAIGAVFFDGDDLHPAANVAKMTAGTPLDDADRAPWLERIGGCLRRPGTVIACSALRRRYREAITAAAGAPVTFLFLTGPREVLAARMAARTGHYMPAGLLDSQIATLEVPGPDERCVAADIVGTPEEIVAIFLAGLARLGTGGASDSRGSSGRS